MAVALAGVAAIAGGVASQRLLPPLIVEVEASRRSSTRTGSAPGRSTATPDRRRRRLELHASCSSAATTGSSCAGPRARRCRRRRTTWSARPALQNAIRAAGFARLAEIVAVCDDESVLGVPFYVMRYLDGHVITQRAAGRARDRGGAARARARPRRHARRDPRRRPSRGGARRVRAPRQLPRAPGAPLHAAVGDQQDARAARTVEQVGRVARRATCRSRCRRPSCTATTASGT